MPDVGAQDRPDHFEARHRRFLLIESAIGSFASGLVPAIVITLVRRLVPMPLHSLAISLIPSTIGPSFTVAVLLTLVVRNRVRRGTAPALGWPLRGVHLARFLPAPLLLRGIVAAVAALLIVPPVGLLIMTLCGVKTISGLGVIAYNFVHGVAQGALVLPAVVTRALADPPQANKIK